MPGARRVDSAINRGYIIVILVLFKILLVKDKFIEKIFTLIIHTPETAK